jgi:site-specific recombinase XerD
MSGRPLHPPAQPLLTPELIAALQQHMLTAIAPGGQQTAGSLPFQFPSLVMFDRRFEETTQRARDVEGLSPKTAAAYRSAYRQFRAYLVEARAENDFLAGQLAVQRRVLEGWIAWLRQRGANHTTVNTYWRSLHAPIARIAREEHMIDPTRYVETPRPGRSMPKFLERPELEEVFRFVRNYQWRGGAFERHRNVALIAVMALGGCRRGEVLNMAVADVDCSAGTIRINKGKGQRGGKPRMVYMSPALVAAMASYLDVRAERKLATPNVFVATIGDRAIGEVTIRRLCRFIKEMTGIHVASHMLRHTCATLMRQAGIPDRLSMDQLGHSRLEVLQRYSHVANGELQKAVSRFGVDMDIATAVGEPLDAVILRQPTATGMTESLTPARSVDRLTPPKAVDNRADH